MNRLHTLLLALVLCGCSWPASADYESVYVINVIDDFGATGDSTTPDQHAEIQAAFDYALSLTLDYQNFPHGVVLYFPAGFYRISEAIEWSGSAEAFFKLRVLGDGMDQSIIFGSNPNEDIFHMEQTGAGYVGYLMFEHIQLYYGRHAVYADNFSYSSFDNVRFRGNGLHGTAPGGPSIKLDGNTVMAMLRDSNFVHGGDVLEVTNGNMQMLGNTIGEDVGNIRVRGSLAATGNYWSGGGANKKDPAGIFSMGGASVSCEGESVATFTGNTIGSITSAFINVDQCIVSMVNNNVTLSGGTVVRTRRLWGTNGVSLAGGVVRANGSGNMLIDHVSTFLPYRSSVDGVHIRKYGTSTIGVDQAILDGINDNFFGRNPGY